jgi:serine protease Do
MQRQSFKWIVFFLAVLFLTSLACNPLAGDEPEPTSAPTEQPVVVETPTESVPTEELPTPEPSNLVTSLDELKEAVIQIEAEGSFVDPEFGLQLNVGGSGSGFIIDESGIAVTNNHVVTGAALLRVYVAGESEPRNARVLGVSECSDLAIIDLEGEGYRYLDWYDGDITTGLEVYAAGFPLGDPEFTLTSGIVAKERVGGETNWSSVDAVIQHDAIINPGNSGGPLVTSDAKVVAVNYRGNPDYDYYLAIARDEALKVLDQLRAGHDVDAIGVNGLAVTDGESLWGIWVSSVESGTPAARAGVQGGDIITMMEGLVLSTDGSMSDYCDILRTHSPEDTLSIEVLRYSTQEVLEGELNGDELVVAFSFAQEIEDQVGEDFGGQAGAGYDSYIEVLDDTNTLSMEIPVAWSGQIDGAPLLDDDGSFLSSVIQASSNLEDFWNTYATPGVVFYASDVLAQEHSASSLLDALAGDYDCMYDGRYEYDDGLYAGVYDLYGNCGEVGSVIIELSASPAHEGYLVYLLIQAVNDADLDALEHVLDTFYVVE